MHEPKHGNADVPHQARDRGSREAIHDEDVGVRRVGQAGAGGLARRGRGRLGIGVTSIVASASGAYCANRRWYR